MPATTLSLINSRSNSAIVASTEKTSFPMGPDVSIACVTDTKSIPMAWNCSNAKTSSRVLLANRSNFQTATTSKPIPCKLLKKKC